MHNFQMNINEYLPLRDVVFYTLRQAILKGELEPGERLMEMQLAEQLGVSRTPIREAIRKLELEGLVVMIPRRGAIVAKITEKDLRDVLEVRSSLERLSTELACERMEDNTIIELKKAQEAFKAALNQDDITLQAQRDVEFHDVIYKSTGNLRLIQMLNNLREQMYRYRLEYLKYDPAHQTLIEEHELIIGALSKRDKETATNIIVRHVSNQELTVLKKIQEDNFVLPVKK
ncbi:GntR family transcriptional regulator [Frisingicoccus sp.]|uniref:GntR family transcriptional regulator n=1 Tax=Frisingicoccus sp. TaxID=1918627 RepID=UPI0025B901E5|nr:GntR family transcriptional regulator [Frisingicoccus sp.]